VRIIPPHLTSVLPGDSGAPNKTSLSYSPLRTPWSQAGVRTKGPGGRQEFSPHGSYRLPHPHATTGRLPELARCTLPWSTSCVLTAKPGGRQKSSVQSRIRELADPGGLAGPIHRADLSTHRWRAQVLRGIPVTALPSSGKTTRVSSPSSDKVALEGGRSGSGWPNHSTATFPRTGGHESASKRALEDDTSARRCLQSQ
jgi:hypothetical protein